jgi:hypothetical protein
MMIPTHVSAERMMLLCSARRAKRRVFAKRMERFLRRPKY